MNGGDGGGGDDNIDSGGGPGKPLQNQSQRFEARGQIFGNQILAGRGGGVALIINAESAASAEVSDCEFLENVAAEFGGGMYTLLQGLGSHTLTVSRNRFEGNVSPSTGGGLHVTFISQDSGEEATDVFIRRNDFIRNRATYGGGAFILPLTLALVTSRDPRIGLLVQVQDCVFRSNEALEAGSALGVSSVISLQRIRPLQIIGCSFICNVVKGAGIVSLANVPTDFSGNNVFSRNEGPSLAVIAALVRVFDSLQFTNNNNRNSLDGGALYITSLGQVQFSPGTRLLFSANRGTTGAAIVIKNLQLSRPLARQPGNPLCPFLFSDRSLPPGEWQQQNVSVIVVDNEAVVSSGVNINNVELCSWIGFQDPAFAISRVFKWNFIQYSDNINTAHGNPMSRRFVVQTPPVRLRLVIRGRSNEIRASPGEATDMQIFAHDEFDIPTTALVGFLDDSNSSNSCSEQSIERYRLSPSSASLQEVHPSYSFDVRFTVQSDITEYPREEITVRTVAGVKSIANAKTSFNYVPQPCPPGRILQQREEGSSYSQCTCNVEREDIMECDRSMVITDDLLWSYSDLTTDEDNTTMTPRMPMSMNTCPQRELSPAFHTIPCPRKYCQCTVDDGAGVRTCLFKFDRNAPFDQCQCNRTGILCGGCVEGTGFSALLNSCKSCDSSHGVLILGLILADIVIIVLALLLMLPLPALLYPTLFYLQLLPHLTDHFPITFEKLSPYLVYVGSVLGLYFPYDFCLHSNMSAVSVYVLRYIPTLVFLVLAPGVVWVRAKKCRPCDWYALYWLVVLLYTPTLHTSMSLLDCPALEGEAPFTPRWYVDGNVKCFQDAAHVPVGLFALLVLVCCVGLIPLSVLIALDKVTKPYWICHLTTPLTALYKEKYRWWCGVELGKRALLVLFAVAFKKNDYAVIVTLVCLLAMSGFFKPYKNMLVNVLDMLYAVDIYVLLTLRNTVDLEELMQEIPQQTEESGECEDIEGYSPFTVLLAPFYYLPLLLGVASLAAWGVWHLYGIVRNDWMPLMEKKSTRSVSIVFGSESAPVRARTQTVVEMSECETSSPVSSDKLRKKFSFKVRQPHIRLGSKKKAKTKSEPVGEVRSEKEAEAIAMQELNKSTSLKRTDMTDTMEPEAPLITSTNFTVLEERDSFSDV